MAVINVGPEDESYYTFAGSRFYTTSGADIETAMSRNGSVTNNTNSIRFPFTQALNDFWFHACVRWGASAVTGNPTMIFRNNSTATNVIQLVNSAANVLKVQRWSGGAWIDIGGTFTPGTTRFQLDVRIKTGTGGAIEIYQNGSSLYSFSGTVTVDEPDIDSVVYGGSATSGTQNNWSQSIVADEPTIGWRLETLELNAAGDVNTFTSGTYLSIDETQLNTGDFIESNTVGHEFLGNIDAPGSFTGEAIRAVCVTGHALISAIAVPVALRWITKMDGIQYTHNELNVPKTSVNTVGDPLILDLAPDATVWDVTKITGLQVGVDTV